MTASITRIIPASAGAVGLLYCSLLVECCGRAAVRRKSLRGQPATGGAARRADAHYDVLNFNDFANGYVPLFAMIATGGPFTEFIEMSYAVTGVSGLGCIYFVSFYVVGCLVAVNVFSAFVIDAFLSQYEEGRALRGTRSADIGSSPRGRRLPHRLHPSFCARRRAQGDVPGGGRVINSDHIDLVVATASRWSRRWRAVAVAGGAGACLAMQPWPNGFWTACLRTQARVLVTVHDRQDFLVLSCLYFCFHENLSANRPSQPIGRVSWISEIGTFQSIGLGPHSSQTLADAAETSVHRIGLELAGSTRQ